MRNIRITAIILIVLAIFAGFFVYSSEYDKEGMFGLHPLKLGLDLNGGTHLVYQADTSKTLDSDINGAMSSLRNVIEDRINVFGVAEPIVQVEQATIDGKKVNKLVVELPGVTDVQKAVEMIGKTPILEFKLLNEDPAEDIVDDTIAVNVNFEDTGLTGEFLERAEVNFDPGTGAPQVLLSFNSEGKKLFADITKQNVGRVLAIFLDGNILSTPVIREEISDGKAQITGSFTAVEAKQLVQDLNYGALPLPVNLIGTQSIGPSLGAGAVQASINAGIISFIIISLFLIIWYRLPGFISVIALAIYTVLNLAVFKLIPVTLTSAGLAGFILSIGMAVDANILIFERMKEELRKGRELGDAVREGFHRAWLSIRDSNLSSIITAVILYYFATTSLIRGFALVFGIGVIISMFTAITISRTFLMAIGLKNTNKFTKFIFGNGFSKK